ncbi:unnamed protein product [Victoria cruziana]
MGSLVLSQPHFCNPLESQGLVAEVKVREQECFSLLRKCSTMDEFKHLHAQSIKLGLDQDVRPAGDLVAACALSVWGSMDYARSIFDRTDNPNPFIWNTMIRGYVDKGEPEKALLLFKDMIEADEGVDNFTFPFVLKGCAHLSALPEGIQVHGLILKLDFGSDLFIQNSLISMYGRCGEVVSCRLVFDLMPLKNVASWSAVISAYTKMDLYNEGLRLFEEMQIGGWKADVSTLVSMLSVCAHLNALDFGRSIHGAAVRNLVQFNVIVYTSLIDMYVKCGCLEKGLQLFNKMSTIKNSHTYSVMISGLALHGHGKEALDIFFDMLAAGVVPDETVYTSVLSACSHSGLVDEGLHCFDKMRVEHKIVPTMQHYVCLVDLLGRAGMLDEAYEAIQRMPMKPNDVVWRCLLSACRVHHNTALGELAGRKLYESDQQCVGDFVLLSNIYAQAQRWNDMAAVRMMMVQKGLIQIPGFSIVEVNKALHKFVSQDKSHPQSKQIYEMLYQIGWQLRFEGYRPDTSEILFDVDAEEKQRLLAGHSQKLAIAFALISTSPGSPIRITKNLRMCSDCHLTTTLISKIFKREIIVRDRNRFHHFKEGVCSCKNYW